MCETVWPTIVEDPAPMAELRAANGTVVAHHCEACGYIVSDRQMAWRNHEESVLCPVCFYVCVGCGKTITKVEFILHPACSAECAAKAEAERDLARYRRAKERIPAAAYYGQVWYDGKVYEFLGSLLSAFPDPPAWVYACSVEPLAVTCEDIDELVSDKLNGAAPQGRVVGDLWDEIVLLVERWNAKQTWRGVYPDYRRVVVIDPARCPEEEE